MIKQIEIDKLFLYIYFSEYHNQNENHIISYSLYLYVSYIGSQEINGKSLIH